MMPDTKHTKGPWQWEEHSQKIGRELAGRYRITAKARLKETANIAGPGYSCDIVAVLPVGSEANARLIAASPDLLAACKEFVRKVECGEARSKRSYKQMKSAIALTKGETK